MKTLILSSSIFYLLGLKLTNQVELNQKSLNDSLNVKTQKEIILPEKEARQLSDENETLSPCGSEENISPWVSTEELD